MDLPRATTLYIGNKIWRTVNVPPAYEEQVLLLLAAAGGPHCAEGEIGRRVDLPGVGWIRQYVSFGPDIFLEEQPTLAERAAEGTGE